jgi:hypothetical protein
MIFFVGAIKVLNDLLRSREGVKNNTKKVALLKLEKITYNFISLVVTLMKHFKLNNLN